MGPLSIPNVEESEGVCCSSGWSPGVCWCLHFPSLSFTGSQAWGLSSSQTSTEPPEKIWPMPLFSRTEGRACALLVSASTSSAGQTFQQVSSHQTVPPLQSQHWSLGPMWIITPWSKDLLRPLQITWVPTEYMLLLLLLLLLLLDNNDA